MRPLALWLLVCLALLSQTGPASRTDEERLTAYLNLGKAFYENPTTQKEAAEQFALALKLRPTSIRERLNYALALLRAGDTEAGVKLLEAVQQDDPQLPHTWFNLGIQYKKAGETEKALPQFEQVAKLDPNEAITRHNLGVLYKALNRREEAIQAFQLAAQLDPSLAAPHFQLFNLLRQAGQAEAAKREFALFQKNKEAQEVSGVKEDVDWSAYSEIYEPREADGAGEEVTAEVGFGDRDLGAASGAVLALVADPAGSGTPAPLILTPTGLLTIASGKLAPLPNAGDLKLEPRSAAAGDYDNDGRPDLVLVGAGGVTIWHNEQGRYQINRQASQAISGDFATALWLDYDHDYDLDLFLFGKDSKLLRNQGQAGFADQTGSFPFDKRTATGAVGFMWLPDSKSNDIAVAYADGRGVLYRDRLVGQYEALPLTVMNPGLRDLAAVDIDNNGRLDLVGQDNKGTHILRNLPLQWAGKFIAGATNPVFADVANRGRLDLIAGGKVWNNQGRGEFVASNIALPGKALAAADFTGDGKQDVLAVADDGTLHLHVNQTRNAGNFVRVALEGVKNLKAAPGAEVEVKSGSLYVKRRYDGYPLTVGVGNRKTTDTLRITWPNGLIQNEVKQPVNQTLSFKEAQRLSGSCPLIFTWDGEQFRYITDVLGVAPLGAMSGDGQFFPTDSDEYIHLPKGALKAKGGKFEVRVAEELSEVSYLDRVQLLAVDHPQDEEVFSSEKWKGPPFPEFRLYGIKERKYPVRAVSHRGADQLPALLKADKYYADDFRRNYIGVAEQHYLELDFGGVARDNRAVLVLDGWVDWADGSTFLQQSQEGTGLQPPSLQVQDAQGKWVTVIEDMGMPSGKPKTITVDLTGKFLSASRKIRIHTNLCVFWDEIFLGENSAVPTTKLHWLRAEKASLRFRGFSPSVIHPERRQPETFSYENPTVTSYWNPTPGLYTKYGDVTPLMQGADDELVLVGSGDELALSYNAEQLPPVPPGMTRDYFLKFEGWAKDRDANTAYSQNTHPLPFHGMRQYPYAKGERYPQDARHRRYLRTWNTRPGLVLIRPLAEDTRHAR